MSEMREFKFWKRKQLGPRRHSSLDENCIPSGSFSCVLLHTCVPTEMSRRNALTFEESIIELPKNS